MLVPHNHSRVAECGELIGSQRYYKVTQQLTGQYEAGDVTAQQLDDLDEAAPVELVRPLGGDVTTLAQHRAVCACQKLIQIAATAIMNERIVCNFYISYQAVL